LLRYARHGTSAFTEPGRRAADGRFEQQIREQNPDLPDIEVRRRARYLRKAFYIELGRKSAASRKAKANRGSKQEGEVVEVAAVGAS